MIWKWQHYGWKLEDVIHLWKYSRSSISHARPSTMSSSDIMQLELLWRHWPLATVDLGRPYEMMLATSFVWHTISQFSSLMNTDNDSRNTATFLFQWQPSIVNLLELASMSSASKRWHLKETQFNELILCTAFHSIQQLLSWYLMRSQRITRLMPVSGAIPSMVQELKYTNPLFESDDFQC